MAKAQPKTIEPSADATPRRRPARKTRAEKNAENKLALFHAAADVVGEVGYQEASVSKIVEKAGLSIGTFYIHFTSRQDILDALLPFVGEEIFEVLRRAVSGAKSFLEVEERGLKGYFDYVLANPSYARILTEGAVFAPEAYRAHEASALTHFTASLKRSLDRGELDGFTEDDLPTLAHMLLGARVQLVGLLMKSAPKDRKKAAEAFAATYTGFVRNALAKP